MSTFRLLIASVCLLCFFISCKKEDTPVAGEKFLRQVVGTGDSIAYQTYSYDAQMRLATISGSSNNVGSGTSETLIEYDSTGNPIKFTHHHHFPNPLMDQEWVSVLVYENDKVVQKIVNHNTPTSYITSNTYSYDMKGRLISDKYNHFIYDDNDDVIKILSPGRLAPTDTTTLSYDSNINPYSSLGLILYFITDSNDLLSKHNKTRETYNWYDHINTKIYTYEYENRLPKKMTLSWDNGISNNQFTYDFYYN